MMKKGTSVTGDYKYIILNFANDYIAENPKELLGDEKHLACRFLAEGNVDNEEALKRCAAEHFIYHAKNCGYDMTMDEALEDLTVLNMVMRTRLYMEDELKEDAIEHMEKLKIKNLQGIK